MKLCKALRIDLFSAMGKVLPRKAGYGVGAALIGFIRRGALKLSPAQPQPQGAA